MSTLLSQLAEPVTDNNATEPGRFLSLIQRLGECVGLVDALALAITELTELNNIDGCFALPFENSKALNPGLETERSMTAKEKLGLLALMQNKDHFPFQSSVQILWLSDSTPAQGFLQNAPVIQQLGSFLSDLQDRHIQTLMLSSVQAYGQCEFVLAVYKKRAQHWTPDEIKLFQIVTDHLSLRLLYLKDEEARHRALVEHERMQQILEGSNDATFDWNLINHFSHTNERFHEITGSPSGTNMLYADFMNQIHPDDREYVAGQFKQHLQDDKPYQIIYRFMHASGEYRYFLTRCKTVRNLKGSAIRSVGAITDITQVDIPKALLQKTLLLTV